MTHFEVIIIGGSYAGLSAALALGRSLRTVLVIDDKLPCNAPTPHSHNFLTQDGKTPMEIATLAKADVLKYKTVQFLDDTVTTITRHDTHFKIYTKNQKQFTAKKIVLATGIKDVLPAIPGFNECWGISVVHCPFCHGYEFKEKPTALMANGEMAMHLAGMIRQLTGELKLLTNGKPNLTAEQLTQLKKHLIKTIPEEIIKIEHTAGQVKKIILANGEALTVDALYAKLPFKLPMELLTDLGCSITETGHIKVDEMQRTTIPNVFACGDNSSRLRSVANAVASGNKAGVIIHMELVSESF